MREIFEKLLHEGSLSESESFSVFESMLSGETGNVGDASIGAYLFSTAQRKLQGEELTGGAKSLRSHMLSVPLKGIFPGKKLLDTCGTGGSGLRTFSVSTAAAFVCAAHGQPVAKHGNRSASSKCGSADVLEQLGMRIDLPPEGVLHVAKNSGFGFMFAPLHHPATKRVVRVRKELGFRTIFNFLGPLSNPAFADCQLLGVSDREMLQPIIETLRLLGVERAMVVCGEDGLDELTINGSSEVRELKDGEIRAYSLYPEAVGVKRCSLNKLVVDSPEASAKKIRTVLEGFDGPEREIVALNAGAALYVSGHAESIEDGVVLACSALDSGAALNVLEQAVEASREWNEG